MPDWSGIEDASPVASRVWLSRELKEDAWKPIRKCDSKALNESYPERKQVLIENGRATADPEAGKIVYNLFRRDEKELRSAIWFLKDPSKGNKENPQSMLVPLSDTTASQVEEFYQKIVYESSSLGGGIAELLKASVLLTEEPEYKVVLQKSDDRIILRKSPVGWFGGKSFDLQRGYGAYKVPGEEEEQALGPVRRVFFVVHGIGEAMWSREDVDMNSLVQDMEIFRQASYKRQYEEWTQDCEKAKKEGKPEPPPPDRAEFIPIEWFDHIHSSSSALKGTLEKSTLDTIPAMRSIANDVVFDVLMYLTPNFCGQVLECVTDSIRKACEAFKRSHPKFESYGGTFNLIGHSLGSVICWDLLAILKEEERGKDSSGVQVTGDERQANLAYQHYATEEKPDVTKHGSWGPSLSSPMKKKLPFLPEITIFIGSPIGLFLSLRGAQPVFDEMRKIKNAEGEVENAVSTFTLPTGSLYNIFNAYDPVAYRIEPLLLAQDKPKEDLEPPVYLTRVGQDVRFHVKARQITDNIKRVVSGKSTFSSIVSQVVARQASVKNLTDSSVARRVSVADSVASTSSRPNETISFPLGGKNDRVDYQLQPGVIQEPYIAAISAHSTYFTNRDFLEFVNDLASPRNREVIDVDSIEVTLLKE